MKITTETNQQIIALLFETMNIVEVFRPVPPSRVADGIMQLDESCWLCGTNSAGFITLHVLEECSKAEAWQFFETMRGPNTKHINPRMTFVGGPSVPANN